MSGGEISRGLSGATFLGEVRTAPSYRFYSVRDEFPGLSHDPENGGTIAGELYEADYATLREGLLPLEPPELELSVIELEDGSGSLSMVMRKEAIAHPDSKEITEWGGWRAYKAAGGPADG